MYVEGEQTRWSTLWFLDVLFVLTQTSVARYGHRHSYKELTCGCARWVCSSVYDLPSEQIAFMELVQPSHLTLFSGLPYHESRLACVIK